MKKGIVDPQVLKEIVRRIVTCAHPEKIILFGSGARGEMSHDSDIDLLVIKEGEFDAGNLTEKIYMHLIGIGKRSMSCASLLRTRSGTATHLILLYIPLCSMAGRFTMADWYLPDVPREWLNRGRSNLALLEKYERCPGIFLKTLLLIRNGSFSK